jgi:putative endonuclease
MSYFVYAIKSQTKDWIYVGITDDIQRRMKQHNSGHTKSTKPYLPFDLIYFEECLDRPSARTREVYFKSSAGKTRLRKMLKS